MDILKKIIALLVSIPCCAMQQKDVTVFAPYDFEYIKQQIAEIVEAEYYIDTYLNKMEFNTTDYLLNQKVNQLNEIRNNGKKNLLAVNNRLNSHQRELARELYTVQEMYIITCCEVTMSNGLDQALLFEQKIRKRSFDSFCAKIANQKPCKPQKHIVDKYYDTCVELQRLSLQCKNLQIDSLLNDAFFHSYMSSVNKELICRNSLKAFYDKQPQSLKIQYRVLEKTIERYIEIFQKKDSCEKYLDYTQLEIERLNSTQLTIQQCEKNDTRENRIIKRDLQVQYEKLKNQLNLINTELNEHMYAMETTKNIIKKIVDQTPATECNK